MPFDPNPIFYAMARIMSDHYFKAAEKRCIRIRNEGSSRCFAGQQLINTDKGPKPIKNIEPVDMVLTFNESTKQEEYKPVEHLHQFINNKPVVRLKMRDGSIIECTEDHEFYYEGAWYSLKHLLSLKEKRK